MAHSGLHYFARVFVSFIPILFITPFLKAHVFHVKPKLMKKRRFLQCPTLWKNLNLSPYTSTQDQWSLKNFCLLKPLVIQNLQTILKCSLQPPQISRICPAFQNTLSRFSLVKMVVEKKLVLPVTTWLFRKTSRFTTNKNSWDQIFKNFTQFKLLHTFTKI